MPPQIYNWQFLLWLNGCRPSCGYCLQNFCHIIFVSQMFCNKGQILLNADSPYHDIIINVSPYVCSTCCNIATKHGNNKFVHWFGTKTREYKGWPKKVSSDHYSIEDAYPTDKREIRLILFMRLAHFPLCSSNIGISNLSFWAQLEMY